jgi:hypothetical protein
LHPLLEHLALSRVGLLERSRMLPGSDDSNLQTARPDHRSHSSARELKEATPLRGEESVGDGLTIWIRLEQPEAAVGVILGGNIKGLKSRSKVDGRLIVAVILVISTLHSPPVSTQHPHGTYLALKKHKARFTRYAAGRVYAHACGHVEREPDHVRLPFFSAGVNDT